jgi:recombination protein RecA
VTIGVNAEAPATKAAKFKALLGVSKKLDEQNKTENSLVRLGDKVGKLLPSISTGLPTLDHDVIGCGGFPKGRVIEVYGPESAGKTSVVLHVVGEVQQAGGVAAFVDAEHALDPNYAKVLGVNVDELVVMQPNTGEQALDAVDKLVESRAVDIVVVDSVSALVPEAELNGQIGDVHMGLQARMMSQAMRILVAKCATSGITLVFINQIREKIGVMFGSPETTSGGRALKFAASLRLDVRRKEEIKDGTVLVGHAIKIKAKKNKCGVPFKETIVKLMYATGFDKADSIIEFANTNDIFTKEGHWFYFGKDKDGKPRKVGYGLDAAKKALTEDAALLADVKVAVQKFIVQRAVAAEEKVAA